LDKGDEGEQKNRKEERKEGRQAERKELLPWSFAFNTGEVWLVNSLLWVDLCYVNLVIWTITYYLFMYELNF
jgi:hypothetical protein